MPRVLVRETSVCSTKGQRPTLTTRHGSTRLVRANTQKPGLFWFPGRYPDSPLFSPTTPAPLSVSVFRDSAAFSPSLFFLLSPFLIRPFRALGFSLRLSRSALLPSLSLFSPIPSAAPLSPRCIPMSVKPIAAWNDGMVLKWGLTECRRPVTSGCVREYGSTRGKNIAIRGTIFSRNSGSCQVRIHA